MRGNFSKLVFLLKNYVSEGEKHTSQKRLVKGLCHINQAGDLKKFQQLLLAISQNGLGEALSQETTLYQLIRYHLKQFYQEHAAYILPLTGEGNKWPIVYTYRQLALVTAIESRILYVVKALDAAQLPDASALVSPAIVVTAIGIAYLIERGRWLRERQSDSLIQIQGVVLPKNLEAIPESDPRRVIEHEGASQIVKQVMERYASMGGREAVLRTYETRYEHYEKRQIALEHVWESREGEKHPQRILVTGRAGIGKSTLLQYIAYCWSLDGAQAVPEPIKPLWQAQYAWIIWLPLKLLHREESVEDDKKATPYRRIAYFIQKVCGLEQLEAAEDSDFTKSLAQLLRQHEARTLLLVDSFDEVAYWVTTDCPRGQLLRALFQWQGPMMVTTRPYAQSQLPSAWKPDRRIENEGFVDADIEAFVRHYFEPTPQAITDNKATRLLRILRQNIGIWSLAHVPLMTRLLCLHWQQATAEEQDFAEQSGKQLTLTGILKVFVEGFVRRSVKKMAKDQEVVLPEDDKLLPSVPLDALYNQHNDWLAILAHLAFEGLRRGQNQILSLPLQETILRKALREPADKKDTQLSDIQWKNRAGLLFQNALKLGLLQPIGQAMSNPLDTQHTFLHLLFQEYLAAYYIDCHLEEPEIQAWIRINRYLGQYQYVFTFAAGLVGDDPHRQQAYWGLLQDSPRTVNGLAELELGLMCLPETRHRSALGDKVIPLFAVSQDWLARLMDPEEVLFPHEVPWVTQRLLPLWQRLSIVDGNTLLGKWQTQLIRWKETTEDTEEAKRVIGLCQVLGPIGAPLIGWLPNGFIEAGIHRLTSEDWEKREQGLQLLIGLRQQLITQEDSVAALIRLVLTGPASSKVVSVTLLQQLDVDQLLSYGEFKKQVNACLESLELEVQTWGWQLLRYLGRKTLDDKSFRPGIEAVWWSWDLELHEQIERDLRYFGYPIPILWQVWYTMIQALYSLNTCKRAIQGISKWRNTEGIEQFQKGLRHALCSTKSELIQAGLRGLEALGIDVMDEAEKKQRQRTEALLALLADASRSEAVITDSAEQEARVFKLRDQLMDPDYRIRSLAWQDLEKMAPKVRELRTLFEDLRVDLVNEVEDVWEVAIAVLGQLGVNVLEVPELCCELQACLSDKNKEIRHTAWLALGCMGPEIEQVPKLFEGLQVKLINEDKKIQGAKQTRLEILMGSLETGLTDGDEEILRATLSAIGKLGIQVLNSTKKLHEALHARLGHREVWMRKIAVSALGDLGGEVLDFPEYCKSLESILCDNDENVRQSGLKALKHLGVKVLDFEELRNSLSVNLCHQDIWIRGDALQALEDLGDAVLNFPELRKSLNDNLKLQDQWIREKALSVLGNLGIKVLDFPELSQSLWMNLCEPRVRQAVLKTLKRLGAQVLETPGWRGGLGALLLDKDERHIALMALSHLGSGVLEYVEIRQGLKECLFADDTEIRQEAWLIFAPIGTGVSIFPEFLKDSMDKSVDEDVFVEDIELCSSPGDSVINSNTFVPKTVTNSERQTWLEDNLKSLVHDLASGKAGIVAKSLKSLTSLGSLVLEHELLRIHVEVVLQRWTTESVVVEALSLLSELGPRCLSYPTIVDSLCHYLNSPSTEVRCAALNCLGAMGPKLLEVMTRNHLNQEAKKASLMEQHTREILLKIDLSLGDTILEAVSASQLLLAILEEEPQLNEKVRQVVKVLSRTTRIRLWQDWLQEIISNPDLQSPLLREQFYLFLASLVKVPGCLASLLAYLKAPEIVRQHTSLVERLLTPQNLRVLLKEYQNTADSYPDSGLAVGEYVDLIQWVLQRPRMRAVLEIDHIILYEETVYHTIALDAEKIRQLQPSDPPSSQADISMPNCQATLFASKLDLDSDPKEPSSRFDHLYCHLI